MFAINLFHHSKSKIISKFLFPCLFFYHFFAKFNLPNLINLFPMRKNHSSKKKDWFNQYLQALKNSFQRVWYWKFLWFWGILLPGGIGFNFSSGQIPWNEKDDTVFPFSLETFLSWIQTHWIITSLVIGLIIFLIIISWLLSAIARNGLIKSLNEIQDKQPEKFKQIWHFGKKGLTSILKLDLFFALITFLVIIILIFPLVILFYQVDHNLFWLIPTVGFIMLLVPIFILGGILLFYMKNIALIKIVLTKQKVVEVFKYSYQFIRKNLGEVLKLFLFRFFMSITKMIIALGLFIIILIFLLLLIVPLIVFHQAIAFWLWPVLTLVFSLILSAILIFSLIIKSIFSLWSLDFWVWWVKKTTGK